MAIAVERGTPLADVLRAQATDVREEGRRALLEAGGRKEIAMLVPVVFIVLAGDRRLRSVPRLLRPSAGSAVIQGNVAHRQRGERTMECI